MQVLYYLHECNIFFCCNISDLLFKILYADDTCVLINGQDIRKLVEILNTELEKINSWLKANKSVS